MGKGVIVRKLEIPGHYRVRIEYNNNYLSRIKRLNLLIWNCDELVNENPIYYKALKQMYLNEIDIIKYEQAQLEEYYDAWCLDYVDLEIGAIVGTIEVGRDNTSDVLNIQPGWENQSKYKPERDGIAKSIKAMNGVEAYYNLAISPSVQKFHPRYRHGIAYNIDYENDKCDVRIYPATLAGKGAYEDYLYVDEIENISGVPIEYMDCNAEPFIEGSAVTIEFGDNDWQRPKVKGFKTHPQPCLECWVETWDPEEGICKNHTWSTGYNTYGFRWYGDQRDCVLYSTDYLNGPQTIELFNEDESTNYAQITCNPYPNKYTFSLTWAANNYQYSIIPGIGKRPWQPDPSAEDPITYRYLYIDYEIDEYLLPAYDEYGRPVPSVFWIAFTDENQDRFNGYWGYPDVPIFLILNQPRDILSLYPWMDYLYDYKNYPYSHTDGVTDIFDLASCCNSVGQTMGNEIRSLIFNALAVNMKIYSIRLCKEYLDPADEARANK